jgi:hypothetical protein
MFLNHSAIPDFARALHYPARRKPDNDIASDIFDQPVSIAPILTALHNCTVRASKRSLSRVDVPCTAICILLNAQMKLFGTKRWEGTCGELVLIIALLA